MIFPFQALSPPVILARSPFLLVMLGIGEGIVKAGRREPTLLAPFFPLAVWVLT
jgi:hypothetical protein